ncbi:hypothetical protein J6590_094757 [Homalodisca vitripennis]|nr:hypothetical protein J6590_094757 [Homalodisca vitripennis]
MHERRLQCHRGLKQGPGLQSYRAFKHGRRLQWYIGFSVTEASCMNVGYSVAEASNTDVDCSVTEASGMDVGYSVTEVSKLGQILTSPGRYRPMSFKSSLCKVLERMVNGRLLWFLEKNNLSRPGYDVKLPLPT